VIATVGFVALVVGGCSGDSGGRDAKHDTTSSTAVSGAFDKVATNRIRNIVIGLQHRFPGQCRDTQLLPYGSYVPATRKLGLSIPLSAVDCTGLDETLEFSVFRSDAERATWVRKRGAALCRRAKEAKYPLAGLHWAVASKLSIQTESEAMARKIAPAVAGSYQLTACPGMPAADWDRAAEVRAELLAKQLAARRAARCANFQFVERSNIIRDPGYAGRVPDAYGQCTGPGQVLIGVATFTRHPSLVGRFVAGETAALCKGRRGVQAVQGDDYAIVVTQVNVAANAAVATGGRLLPPAC
jgi:hypothetical protein